MQSMAGIQICGRALGMAGSQKYGFTVISKCFWGNVESSGELKFLGFALSVFSVPLLLPILVYSVCWQSLYWSARIMQNLQGCCLKIRLFIITIVCVSQLISSSWISELQFAHSISPSCGLIVTGIIQGLCSLAVQNQVFFTSFCQQKHADAVLGWATWELASAPDCASKAFMIMYSSDHY